ncbi:MAG: hypothetical protein J1F35_06225 [Erysipelotrichales bacterium]|nr:hypothetical protein [Erysipelotrichales bacterium]
MIIDRTWNKFDQRLTISYLDKNNKRKIWKKYLHHISTYEFDDNGKYDTWDGKKANRIFKDSTQYKPNEFDLLELMYKMKDDPETAEMYKDLKTAYPSKLYCYDIETESGAFFPDPAIAPMPVTSISLCGPDLSCMVLGRHNLDKEQIELMKTRYFEWIEKNDYARNLKNHQKFEPKFFYQYFETEEKLLEHWFLKILPNIALIVGWNNYRFDRQYLVNRIKKLFGEKQAMNMIKAASPTKEVQKIKWSEMDGTEGYTYGPVHQAEFDYMELVKKYDFVLRPYESYSLDWVGSHAVKAHKIKYEGTIQQLWERDPEWYYYYNAVDSLIVQLIHYRLRCMEPVLNNSSLTLVPVMKAMGQVALTTAGMFEVFYNEGKHVVYDWDHCDRIKVPYEGAFCGCVPGRYEYTICDDFASLYPSQIITCNLSMENIMYNLSEPDSLGRRVKIPWTEEELEKYRKDPNYFVTVMGNVYRNDRDYAFKKFQIDRKKRRGEYKYLGWSIDAELVSYLEHRIDDLEKSS